MNADLMTIETIGLERAPHVAPVLLPVATADSAEARRSPAEGSTAEAAGLDAVLELAQAALHANRQAMAALVGLIRSATEAGVGPEAAAALADHVQAEAEAVQALGARQARLVQALHAAAEALRPTPQRRRAALAENLQRFSAEHQALLLRAESMLAGGQALSPHHLVSADRCGLGHWCQVAGEAGWRQAVAFADLERPHRAFHRALAGVLFAHQQGCPETAALLLGELQAHTAAVGAALDALCARVLEPNAPGSAAADWDAADDAALLALRAGRIPHVPQALP